MGKADTCDGKQTPGRPAAQGGTARRRTHTWLLAKSVAPLQETGKQELPEHLSAVGDTAFKQHSVSILQGMTMRCLCLRESDWAVGVVGYCFGMDAVRRLDSARQGNYNYSYEQWKPRVAPYSTKFDKAPRWLGFACQLEDGVTTLRCVNLSIEPIAPQALRSAYRAESMNQPHSRRCHIPTYP